MKDGSPSAAAFIVTVYGDVAAPRGGILWTGTLIELCGRIGINESLVRTAVSRLVQANQLIGERIGRRSYYRLQDGAHADFHQATDLLYGPEKTVDGWQIIHAPDLPPEEARRLRMGRMDERVYIRPDRRQPPVRDALVFHARELGEPQRIAQYWDLSALHARYDVFLHLFGPVLDDLSQLGLTNEESLIIRLLLVNEYRAVLLRDPRLPLGCLPENWNGHVARVLFRDLYARLSANAERHIAANLQGDQGYLEGSTAESDALLRRMR